jgi:hypothetical protein
MMALRRAKSSHWLDTMVLRMLAPIRKLSPNEKE